VGTQLAITGQIVVTADSQPEANLAGETPR